jgi:uracil DNA glycosylase
LLGKARGIITHSVLTVEKNQPASHAIRAGNITDNVIKLLNEKRIISFLLGGLCWEKSNLIDLNVI